MNIIFLTISYPIDVKSNNNLYVDLVNELRSKGNNIYVVTSNERRNKKRTYLENIEGVNVLRVKTGNLQKINVIEKGISTILISYQFERAINKYFKDIKFDLIVYSTPPITFNNLIKRLKQKNNAKTYLLLKDIFPQNAVDLGMIKDKGVMHTFFRNKEINLYKCSDYIGCMSDLNKKYLLRNNLYIKEDKVEVFPNSIKVNNELSFDNKEEIKKELEIPKGAFILIYGGNLGKPQGINFLLTIMKLNKNNNKIYFVIVGSGTEFSNIKNTIEKNNIKNVKILSYVPKSKFNKYLSISDIGLIFLDKHFTIPNIPSRMLSYMENSLPIIAATDKNTDLREYIRAGGFGEWCENGDINSFKKIVNKFMYDKELLKEMGRNSRKSLERKFDIKRNINIMLKHFY